MYNAPRFFYGIGEKMVTTIIKMYITLIPPILSGMANMAFCKSDLLKSFKKPIDGGRKFVDGKRIFGENKTWKGVIGYLLFNMIFYVIWGMICNILKIEHLNFFYYQHKNTQQFNILIGLLLGIAYSLFELPNSFMKRRMDIVPGKTMNGPQKVFFIFLDQADSIFGLALVVWMFYDLGIAMYIAYVLIGAFTHIIVNIFLYKIKLRKNMF